MSVHVEEIDVSQVSGVSKGRIEMGQIASGPENGPLMTLLVDQDAGKSGLRTDFLGRPASTWPGAARMSLRTGCPVVALAIVREEGGSHELRFGRTLEPDDFRDGPDPVRDYTAAISGAVETFIRERPDQWFWVHRRWKGAHEAG